MLFQLPDRRWGLVDSNIADWRDSSPIDELAGLYDVRSLEFLGLTHPHTDHYLGMPGWIDRFSDTIENYWDPDLSSYNSYVLKKMYYNRLEVNQGESKSSWSDPNRRKLEAFARVYSWLRDEKKGYGNRNFSHKIYREGNILHHDADLEIRALAPSQDEVDKLATKLKECESSIADMAMSRKPVKIKRMPDLNKFSGVAAVFYGKTLLLLGSDATGSCWRTITKALEGSEMPKVYQTFVKVPHHGSSQSNPLDAWEALKYKMSTTHAIISVAKTNRYSHPHEETIQRILGLGIELVCTSGIKYEKRGGIIFERDTWTTVYEKSGKYDENGQNVLISIPRRGYPRITTQRFG